MKNLSASALALSVALLALPSHAADPQKLPGNKRLMDHSSSSLISADEATRVMNENIPEKAWKIIKGSQYVWLSQVEGGMRGTTCVVAASNIEACKLMARDKLKEATVAVVSTVVKTAP